MPLNLAGDMSLVARDHMRKPVLRDWLYLEAIYIRSFTGLENLDVVSGSIIPMRGSTGGGGGGVGGPDLPPGKSQVL